MSRELIVNGTTFQYPDPGDEPGWGEDASDWAEAVTEVLDTLLGSNDILETSFTVANNTVSVTNVTGLLFNTSTVRSAVIEYSIYRRSNSTPSGKAEAGIMNMVFDNDASSGNKCLLAIGPSVGNAGVTFSVTDAGQIQYTSSDIGTAGYIGEFVFNARTISQ